MRKSLVLLLVLVMVTTMFAGCTSDPTAGVEQTLLWNIGASPKTIDPGLNAAVDGGHVINNTFEGLMREKDGQYVPAAAEKYEVSDDGLVYTFTIRKGAKWSDGQQVTAKDFEYAWNRVLDPETASEYSWIFSEAAVDSFRAVDDMTFEVTLSTPAPYFLGLTAFYTFFPVREDAVAQGPDGAWAIKPESAISNGPFKLTEYKDGDKLILSKNDQYWDAKNTKLDKIEALMIVEASTAYTAYKSDELHAIDQMPSEVIPQLQATSTEFQILPQDGTYYYSFNIGVEPLNDINVRKALSLAIDRQSICTEVTKSGEIPAFSMVAPTSYDANGKNFTHELGNYGLSPTADVAKAKEYMAAAGFEDGKGFPSLEIIYNTNDNHKKIAEAVQEMWKQNLGIDVSLTNQEWAVFQDTRKQHNFQVARAGWIGDYSDPMTYLGMFVSGSPMNYPGWESAEYDGLLESAKTKVGQERFEDLYKAAKLLDESFINMPIYTYTNTVLVKANVMDWVVTTRSTWYFGNAYITKPE